MSQAFGGAERSLPRRLAGTRRTRTPRDQDFLEDRRGGEVDDPGGGFN